MGLKGESWGTPNATSIVIFKTYTQLLENHIRKIKMFHMEIKVFFVLYRTPKSATFYLF